MKEKKKQEAIKSMKILGMLPQMIDNFIKEGKVVASISGQAVLA
ncbi:hypothetical protein [uncultured Vagococcus sp.]|nr:hypothetical protein [uncultured Vagococcus sp.]